MLAAAVAVSLVSTANAAEDNTITKVVKLLESMMEKSKAEGKEERELYAKFKCYCDDNELEKTDSVSDLTKEIGVLSSKIEELQGSTGKLSTECAGLKQDIAANEAARAEAESIRNKEHEEFTKEEQDMTQAIGQMDEAITALSEIGADQTMGAAADNKKFMAGFDGIAMKVKTTVKQALVAASAFLTPVQRKGVDSFLQSKAPFTGSYTSQSGQIVGILKNMRDTFKANLKSAIATEKSSLAAHTKLMGTLTQAHTEMTTSYDDKQELLGSNDDELATKKEQLAEAENQKASDEEFLEKLKVTCSEKERDYNQRKVLRANEDAAIAETISILNSDEAFASFGKTDATSTGATGFIQLRSVPVHSHSNKVALADEVTKVLSKSNSNRIKKIVASLKKGNPFTEILKQIDEMLDLIEKEGRADQDNLNWCNSERETNDGELSDKNSQIDTLDGEIEELKTTIDDPETGLKAQIKSTEESLTTCVATQKTETKDRVEANLMYQGDIKNLVAAEAILEKALKALKKYYDKLAEQMAEESMFMQAGRKRMHEDPAPPETYGNFQGQSEQGNSAIGMLEFILTSTQKEETEAHSDEENAQHAYEDSMTTLKDEESGLEESLAELQKTLAEKEEELLMKEEEHKKTTKDRDAIENYLEKIKSGCDFITTHFEERETNRGNEAAALDRAYELIEDTPAYQNAVAEAHVETFGDCKEPCVEDEAHVKCKACMAEVTIPAYCAGHEGTPGC